ncbi:hypothetical protein IV203_015907 [Nitzschia inconspicua]|uniref:Uncharacterized protein n=1 Tax=Nitzschia inconspicua TaxID=303405 RepID=A0A9K3LC34_9STRA|nr:hypothetical protein IV203_015907 [Nitzschia inconspicua]
MNNNNNDDDDQTPEEKKSVASAAATTRRHLQPPPTTVEWIPPPPSVVVDDPPDDYYIAPELQDMMFTDITSAKLHDQVATNDIGRGKPYLSPAPGDDSKPAAWPAYGRIFGINRRLMINIPCRRAKREGSQTLNIYFLVDSGSPCSYLCLEAIRALVDPRLEFNSASFVATINGTSMNFYLSPLGTAEQPGKFHDVNVLGMDFLVHYGLTMIVDAPVARFRLIQIQNVDDEILAKYPEDIEYIARMEIGTNGVLNARCRRWKSNRPRGVPSLGIKEGVVDLEVLNSSVSCIIPEFRSKILFRDSVTPSLQQQNEPSKVARAELNRHFYLHQS